MEINNNTNRKSEEVEATKKDLFEILQELHKGYIIHCHYIPGKDLFFVCCYVNEHDDDAFYTMEFDYDEVLIWICDVPVIKH